MKAQEETTVEILVSAGIPSKQAEIIKDYTLRQLSRMEIRKLNEKLDDGTFDGLGELFGPSRGEKIKTAIQEYYVKIQPKFYPLNANPYYVYSVIGFPIVLNNKKYFCPQCKEYVELRSQNREDKDTIYISPPDPSKGTFRTHYSCSECRDDGFEGLGSLFG